jgi:hypothetical protein
MRPAQPGGSMSGEFCGEIITCLLGCHSKNLLRYIDFFSCNRSTASNLSLVFLPIILKLPVIIGQTTVKRIAAAIFCIKHLPGQPLINYSRRKSWRIL